MRDDYAEMKAEEYEKLYARYLERPSRLLVAPDPPVAFTEKTKLLDLCCGPGTVIREAIRLGVRPHNITAMDVSMSFINDLGRIANGIKVVCSSVDTYNLYPYLMNVEDSDGYDIITCRQAVNYWWHTYPVARIAQILKPGAPFVFNTFNRPPAEVPQAKQYIYNDKQFVEVVWMMQKRVHHIQIREGMQPHYTTFWWLPPETFETDLKDLQHKGCIGDWKRVTDGTTDTYIVRGAE